MPKIIQSVIKIFKPIECSFGSSSTSEKWIICKRGGKLKLFQSIFGLEVLWSDEVADYIAYLPILSAIFSVIDLSFNL